MKKIILFLISILIFVSLIDVAFSAPMSWGVALNHETKECAGYWGGDEFTSYVLPDGWKEYYPDYSKYEETGKLVIETEIGDCDFSKGNEDECCNQLGYTFVSQNIGKGKTTSWGLMKILGSLSCFIFFPIVILLIIIFVVLKIKTKSFIPFLESCSKKGLFIGAIIGVLCTLSYYSNLGFSGCATTHPIGILFVFLSVPLHGILHLSFNYISFIFESFALGLFSWFFINLLYFSLVGWIVGFIIRELRKK